MWCYVIAIEYDATSLRAHKRRSRRVGVYLPPPSLSWLTRFFKVPAYLVYYITLNLNISAFRQNIKNLISNFEAIHVGIMHAKFQASCFTGVGWEWGDGSTRDVNPDPYTKFLNSPLRFGRENDRGGGLATFKLLPVSVPVGAPM